MMNPERKSVTLSRNWLMGVLCVYINVYICVCVYTFVCVCVCVCVCVQIQYIYCIFSFGRFFIEQSQNPAAVWKVRWIGPERSIRKRHKDVLCSLGD